MEEASWSIRGTVQSEMPQLSALSHLSDTFLPDLELLQFSFCWHPRRKHSTGSSQNMDAFFGPKLKFLCARQMLAPSHSAIVLALGSSAIFTSKFRSAWMECNKLATRTGWRQTGTFWHTFSSSHCKQTIQILWGREHKTRNNGRTYRK